MRQWHPVPAEVYALVERTPAAILLEHARPRPEPFVSRLFLEPSRILEAGTPEEIAPLLDAIESATGSRRYAAGFLTYEAAQALEP
ncbi:MAG TPA: hypothetical protein VK716_11075, partial [Terracidiphilus sp.]|nr:hypothetical protein [Terracidiphilus sp.]